MANELQTLGTVGSSVYAVIRNSTLQVWNNSTQLFETFASGDWSNYAVALTGDSSGFFSANFPAAITNSDNYAIEFYYGPATIGTGFITGGTIAWNGTQESYNPTGIALTTLSYVQDYANITNSAYSGYLQNRIYGISAAIQRWCNRTFAMANYTEYYDGPSSNTLLLNQNPITAVTSVTLSAQGLNPTVIVGSNIVFNANTGIISVKPDAQIGGWFSYDYWGQQNIQVQYTAGYASIPYDVQEATAIGVTLQYLNRGQDITLMREEMLDYKYQRFAPLKYINEEMMQILAPYRIIAV